MNVYGLKKSFFALAPMAGITNYPFASQCYKFGADILWTPMVHTDVIINNLNEAIKILDFESHSKQNDIKYIIQLVGSCPKGFTKAVQKLENRLNPLGYDINMGCPDKNIVKSGCGGALMNNQDLALEIVKSVQSATERPVSVKTRAGLDNYEDVFEFAEKLNQLNIDMLTVHPRKVTQGYSGQADWEIIKKVKQKTPSLKICGSGDIRSWQDAYQMIEETGCDGVMIGRSALGRPWIFKEIKDKEDYQPAVKEVKKLVLDLSEKSYKIWGDRGIIESRKHYAWYFKGFSGAKDIRTKLMSAKTLTDVKKTLNNQ